MANIIKDIINIIIDLTIVTISCKAFHNSPHAYTIGFLTYFLVTIIDRIFNLFDVDIIVERGRDRNDH